ncbi:restriction endonuclease [Chloroflexota bacterium]
MIELPEAVNISGQLNDTISRKCIANVKPVHTPHKLAWYYGEPLTYSDLLIGRTAPEVQQLAGAAGSNEALFISTGGYTQPALKEAEKHAKMALIDRDGFIQLLLDNYDKLSPEYQSMVPLKRIYVPVIST